MALIEDPNSDARSLMNRAPCVCNGEANGIQCRHYWAIVQKFRAANAEAVRSGEKQRACTKVDGFMLEYTSDEKPTFCNSYEPRGEPGLVGILKRGVAQVLGVGPLTGRMPNAQKPVTWGYVTSDADFETFKPMTPEEIRKLREEMPDRLVVWGHGMHAGVGGMGKNPSDMTVDDIVNGPQIGILKPGEAMPGGLSEETSKEVDGIFGADSTDGIFKK